MFKEMLFDAEVLAQKYAEVCQKLAELKTETEAVRAVARKNGFPFNDHETLPGFALNLMAVIKANRELAKIG